MPGNNFVSAELKTLIRRPVPGFRVEPDESNLMEWTVWIAGPPDTPYEKGQFKSRLVFPSDYPCSPPILTIVSEFWHPNVYPDGKVCISILHPPGPDEMNKAETAMMRWLPTHSIDKILLSVISMIADPDPTDSGAPANVDALVEFRKSKAKYRERIASIVKKSLAQLPGDYIPPSYEEEPCVVVPEIEDGSDYEVEEDDDDDEVFDYMTQLEHIKEMGVDLPDEKILEVLEQVDGQIHLAMEKLMP